MRPDSDHAGPIATSVHDKMKQKFLDRFAEIVSRERHVPGRKHQNSSRKNRKGKSKNVQTMNDIGRVTITESKNHSSHAHASGSLTDALRSMSREIMDLTWWTIGSSTASRLFLKTSLKNLVSPGWQVSYIAESLRRRGWTANLFSFAPS